MSNNSKLPDGCLLFGINSIINWFRNRRIRKYNQQARGVEVYKSVGTDVLLPPSAFYNGIIISGGGQNDRILLSKQIIHNLKTLNYPLIIFHTGNPALENVIASNQLGVVINNRHTIFDCFDGLDFDEILQLVTNTCSSKYDMGATARYIMQIAYELTIARGRNPYFYWLEKCPYMNLGGVISERLKNGLISQSTANHLNSLLSAGQSEAPNVAAFFGDMKAQMKHLAIKDPKTMKPTGILSAIENNLILCIDLKSSTNVMLMELLANSLQVAMNRGFTFSLMLDEVAFANNDLFLNLMGQATNIQTIISSNDIFTLVGAREEIFAALVGRCDKTVVFNHPSNVSCENWSMHLGQYDKIDIANNRSSGWFQSSRWASSAHSGQTESLIRELKVKPEQIRRLSQSEAFIYDGSISSLIQATVK